MRLLTNILIIIVAISHIGFLILEMFLWNHPIGLKIFSMTPEVAKSSTVLAMNQGLYNGFLAAGLIWGLLTNRFDVKVFFLCCVVIAGVFGGITAKPSILLIQGVPAIIALIFVLTNKTKNNIE